MFISWLRLLIIIASAMAAGLNVFNIMSAQANNMSIKMPLLTLIAMLLLIGAILVTQYVNNRNSLK